MARFGKLFKQNLSSPFGLMMILLIMLLVCFAPQYSPNDWELNPAHLPEGLQIYQDGNYLYPPWALIVFWPYYFLGSIGTRVASVLVIALLHIKNRYTIQDFLWLILNPVFIFAMLFSNPDILIFVGAVLLWETRRWFLMGLAFSIITVKPQGAILVIPYLLYQERQHWQKLLKAGLLAGLIMLPVSLLGQPILFLQWLHNIQQPSEFWASMRLANDVSMTSHYGFLITLLALALCGAVVFYRLRANWTKNHSYASLFITSMLLSPYASFQSLIVGFIFIPSAVSTISIALLSLFFTLTLTWKPHEPLWIILFWLISIFAYRPREQAKLRPEPTSLTEN